MGQIVPIMRTKNSLDALRAMCLYIKSNDDQKVHTVIEIGTFSGDSTIIFAENFTSIITVDPFINNIGGITNSHNLDMDLLYRTTADRLCQYKNVSLIKDFSENFSKRISNNTIDIVYIDGLHTYEAVKNDIKVWLPKLKKNGWLCGHDYRKNKFPGVVKAVDEYKKPDKVFLDYSWVIKLGVC